MKTIIFVTVMTFVLRLISYKNTVRLTILLYPLIKKFSKKAYSQFFKNHRVINPQLSENNIHELARNSLVSMSLNYAINMKYMRFKNFDKLIIEELTSKIDDITKVSDGTPTIFITAHIGINSIGAYLLPKALERKAIAPIRQYSNKRLEKLLVKSYSNNYTSILPLGNTIHHINSTLSNNGIILLALDSVIDTKYKSLVEFLGKDFKMTNSVVWLAEKYKARVVPIVTSFNKDYSPVIEVFSPVDISNKDLALQNIADAISLIIRKYEAHWNLPADYFTY